MVRLQDHAKILVTEEISTKLPISEAELALMILNSRVNDCVVSSLENLPDFQGVLDGLILHPHTLLKNYDEKNTSLHPKIYFGPVTTAPPPSSPPPFPLPPSPAPPVA